MNVKWFGHDSFLITSDSGIRIITDPYTPNEYLRHGEVKEEADIVTVSHGHPDHSNVASLKGNPVAVREAATAKGISFKAVPTFHDEAGGTQRGENTVFLFEIDGMNVCHLGDLGHILDDKQAAQLGAVDVLFVPVGGYYTIDAGTANQVVERIQPKVVFPMHYKTDKISMPISGVEDFLNGKQNVKKLDTSEVELKAKELPAATQIIVLKPAL